MGQEIGVGYTKFNPNILFDLTRMLLPLFHVSFISFSLLLFSFFPLCMFSSAFLFLSKPHHSLHQNSPLGSWFLSYAFNSPCHGFSHALSFPSQTTMIMRKERHGTEWADSGGLNFDTLEWRERRGCGVIRGWLSCWYPGESREVGNDTLAVVCERCLEMWMQLAS